MKVLIAQPKRTDKVDELIYAIKHIDCDYIVFPEGYIGHENQIKTLAELAVKYNKAIITSYKTSENTRDKALLINELGQSIINREKSGVEGPLLSPSTGTLHDKRVGYMLCREVFLNYNNLTGSDIIFNPIGVGMFSEDQYTEWTSRARAIAIETKSIVIGASHADGSYRNCGFSIPLAFVFDHNGHTIYQSKNDTRPVVIDLKRSLVTYVELA